MSDGSAVVFNLTTRKYFPVKQQSNAIRCKDSLGPCFGYGELATEEPFNGNENCLSRINQDAYGIPKDSNKMNQLTNTNTKGLSEFTISEIEVWQVKFIQ